MLLSLHGKAYSGELGRRVCRRVEPQNKENSAIFILAVKLWTSSLPSKGSLRVHVILPNKSLCVLWVWRSYLTLWGVLWENGDMDHP